MLCKTLHTDKPDHLQLPASTQFTYNLLIDMLLPLPMWLAKWRYACHVAADAAGIPARGCQLDSGALGTT